MTAMPTTSPHTAIRASAHPDRGGPLLRSVASTTTHGRVELRDPQTPRAGKLSLVGGSANPGQRRQPATMRSITPHGTVTSSRSQPATYSTEPERLGNARCSTRIARSARAQQHPDDDFGPVATPTADLPDAAPWAGRMAMSLLQVCLAARPAPQLMRYVAPDIYDSVLRRHSRAMRRGGTRRPMRVRRVLVCHPRDGVVEATAIIEDAGRIRPVALRMDGSDGRWIVTALEIG